MPVFVWHCKSQQCANSHKAHVCSHLIFIAWICSLFYIFCLIWNVNKRTWKWTWKWQNGERIWSSAVLAQVCIAFNHKWSPNLWFPGWEVSLGPFTHAVFALNIQKHFPKGFTWEWMQREICIASFTPEDLVIFQCKYRYDCVVSGSSNIAGTSL